MVAEAPEATLLVFETERGDWAIKWCQPSWTALKPEWTCRPLGRGRRRRKLAKVTGVDDALFCHTARLRGRK